MIDHIINGIMTAFTFPNLLAAFLGTFAGIIFGALPGFTPSMGIAVLIPFTYAMDTTSGLILLAAVYCGAFYGGSISAILVNTLLVLVFCAYIVKKDLPLAEIPVIGKYFKK